MDDDQVPDDAESAESEERPSLADLAAFVERMIAVSQNAGLASIKIKTSDLRLELQSGTFQPAPVTHMPTMVQLVDAPGQTTYPAESSGYFISAPMVGTFYHSASPSDPPLVQVGDRVEVGQLIGIIEAMKIMNEITADRAGTVLDVLVPNATAVEYGSPLIRLGP